MFTNNGHLKTERFRGTLSFYNNEPSKNKHFLILLSSLARNSQEHKLKRIFEIPWVLFEKSLSLYFDWPKSWIWRTLEKVVNIFCKWHFHNTSKEVFWSKKFWISCTGSKVPFWQFFFFAKMALLNPCMKFKNTYSHGQPRVEGSATKSCFTLPLRFLIV